MDIYAQPPPEASEPPADLVQMNRVVDVTPIQKFYSGTNIFITGGTGFLGKILIEKLLRSCPDLQTIYLLVRGKKGKDMHTRIDEMFDDPIFERLKEENSKFRHKVVGITGDCSIAGLGLNVSDRSRLIDNINVVFHVAATVRFDEKLRLALAINVNATRDLLDLCKQMMSLKSVVHVSTAYSHCNLKTIEEKFYPVPLRPEDVEIMLNKLDDRQLEDITPKILGQWPNTYTFTKALAEEMVKERSKGLPIGVFRPAIVTSTYKEPIVGWIDNLYGPTGVVAGAYTGVLRTLHCDEHVKANIVPVDMCVNALITCAWDVVNSKHERDNDEIPLYNYVSTAESPITWGEFNNLNVMYSKNYPFSKSIWCLNFSMNKNEFVNSLYVLFLHLAPALVIDAFSAICGQKPRLLKMYKKVHKFSNVLAHFCTNEWVFTNNNVQSMWKRLGQADRGKFFFNVAEINWLAYFRDYVKGVRVYLFKDPISTVPTATKRNNRFIWIQQVIRSLSNFLLVYCVFNIISSLYTSLNYY